jgi:hypothetical protein
VFVLLGWVQGAATAGSLFVIIATDDRAPSIGKDMEKNSRMMASAIKRNMPANRRHIVKVEGRSLTPAGVLRTIQLVAPEPDDAILFFYSGHGAYDEQRLQTCVLMSSAPGHALFVDEIQRAIDAKRVSFSSIILDCCNNLRPSLARGPIAPGEPIDQGPSETSALFRRLFFEAAGSVVIESSAPGEYAVTVPALHLRDPRTPNITYHFGSLFTQSFTGVLLSYEDAGDAVPDWARVCRETQESIDTEFPQLCPGGVITLGSGASIRQAKQTVTVWMNGRQISSR